MKKQHKEKTDVDLLIPVIPESIIPLEQTDCFGVEFEGRSSECSICSDSDLCMIVWSEKVKVKKSAFETKYSPLLDQTDLAGVDMIKIEKLARKYQDEDDQPMTFQELQDLIAIQANTKDDEAVIQYIKRELPLTRIYLKEGVCRVR